ncbi:cytochrome c [Yoonia sp.]|uniref:c-type cytochrome n=1 Tax=Yoonia sp. TaxID=2212373 RepID=UPI0019E85547|nr:cytochrome c [Yoonia sp.]MBE0414490.1 cytochrome c [Yoonia sp.]
MRFAPILTSAILFGSIFATNVIALESGEALYNDACATCHGAAGMGEGPLAEYMTVDVPNLTQLSVRNDGVFPMLAVIQTIDGRTGIRGHGSEMPVWGRQFKAETLAGSGIYGSEVYARGKVLSLAYYLESIQEE